MEFDLFFILLTFSSVFRMELEAKEAEQRARRNREKYDGQMQR